ncbi:hypothetical protein [Brevundimonas sp.]|uniref:hypothetical protein n=1 Tax=Brevundimonas sp. TaxID=1871086 RepID=UPI0019CC46C0|nr:hypothetical protein [Brevundimonas sp.]MBD3836671.1 hypothetical protein [Brevundimonas sp.]
MSLIFSLLFAAAVQVAPGPAWTWTLYDGDGPVVLANEAPDTPDLRATLQCDRGSGAVEVSVYDQAAQPGFARVSAGRASTTTEAHAGRDGALSFVVRADHPVFAAFAGSGLLTVVVGDDRSQIMVQPRHLAKLRRFTDLCAG